VYHKGMMEKYTMSGEVTWSRDSAWHCVFPWLLSYRVIVSFFMKVMSSF